MFPDPKITWTQLVGAILGLSVLAGGSSAFAEPSAMSLEPRPIDRIAPGTRVADRAPPGWTHLIFKSRSVLASGDLDALPGFARGMAEMIISVLAVRVAPSQEQGGTVYRIRKAGMAIALAINGEDVVVSNATYKQLGANLGMFQGMVVSGAEDQLARVQQIMRSDTMLVVDAPTVITGKEGNRTVVLRYVFLIDPPTGAIGTIVWMIDLDSRGTYRGAADTAVVMKPNLVSTWQIHVDSKKIFLGVPGLEAFGVSQLPAGTAFPMPAGARDVAGLQRFTEASAKELEGHFRPVLRFPGQAQ